MEKKNQVKAEIAKPAKLRAAGVKPFEPPAWLSAQVKTETEEREVAERKARVEEERQDAVIAAEVTHALSFEVLSPDGRSAKLGVRDVS